MRSPVFAFPYGHAVAAAVHRLLNAVWSFHALKRICCRLGIGRHHVRDFAASHRLDHLHCLCT